MQDAGKAYVYLGDPVDGLEAAPVWKSSGED